MSGIHNNIFQNCYKESHNDIKRYDDSQISPNIFKQTSRKNQEVEEFNYKENKNKADKSKKEEGPYFGLSEGMLTFGKNPMKAVNQDENNEIPQKEDIDQNSLRNTASFKRPKNKSNNSNTEQNPHNYQNNYLEPVVKSKKHNSIIDKENDKLSEEDDFSTNIPDKFGGIGIINNINDNNSFLNVVVQTIWNLQFVRNYLIYDMNICENDSKNRLLFILKEIMIKYSQNLNSSTKRVINIEQLRVCLSELFKSNGKFSLDNPDDPIDVYFAILNSLHSFYNKKKLNEIHDNSCNSKCLVHKYFWIDLSQKEECECKGLVKRLFSYHNYLFDIDLKSILDISHNFGKHDFNKCTKLNINKLNYDSWNLFELKNNLFLMLKHLLNQLPNNCPERGIRCPINQTHKQLYLSSLPNYLSFNLFSSYTFQNSCLNILKILLLIPLKFDISTIFEHSNPKTLYCLFGGINRTQSKTFNCFFSQKNSHNEREWIYYCDDIVTYYKNWFELISRILRNKEIPCMIYYEIKSKNHNFNEKDLSRENIGILENYAVQIDNLKEIPLQIFRPLEDVIKLDNLNCELNSTDVNGIIVKNTENKFKRNQQPICNSTNNTSNSSVDLNDYICSQCNSKNKIENLYCGKCGQNNENTIKDSLRKRKTMDKGGTLVEERLSKIEKENNYGEQNNPFKKDNNKAKVLNYNNSTNEIISSNSKLDRIDKELNKISSDIITNIKNFEKSNIKDSFIDDEKDINFPKQIKNSKTNKDITPEKPNSKIVRDTCNICFEVKCQCDKKLEERPSMKNTKKEIEDRIKPYNIQRELDKKSKMNSRKCDDSEWECENCREKNKINNSKCSRCHLNNKNFNEILENQENRHKLIETISLSKLRNPNENKKTQPENVLKKQIDPQSVDSKKSFVNDTQFNFKRQDCICMKIDDDNLFCNNLCKLCKKPRVEKNAKLKKNIDLPFASNNNNKQLNNNLSNNNIFNKNNDKNCKIEGDNKLFNQNKKCSEVKLQTNIPISNVSIINNNNNIKYSSHIENEDQKMKNRLSSEKEKRDSNFKLKLVTEYRSNSISSKKEQNSRYVESSIQSPPFKKPSSIPVNTDKKFSTIDNSNPNNHQGTTHVRSKQLSVDLNQLKMKTLGKESSTKLKK